MLCTVVYTKTNQNQNPEDEKKKKKKSNADIGAFEIEESGEAAVKYAPEPAIFGNE